MLIVSCRTLGWLLAIYAGVLALTLAYDHLTFGRGGNIDVFRDGGWSIYARPNAAGVYALDKITIHDKQVLLIGSSEMGRGFDNEEVRKHLPEGYHVDKLALNGSNITMYRELLADLKSLGTFADDEDKDLIIVFAGTPFVFVDDARTFDTQVSDLGLEKLRHKLYREDEAGHVAPRFEAAGLMHFLQFTLVKPVVWLYAIKMHSEEMLNDAAYAVKYYFLPPKLTLAQQRRKTALQIMGEEGLNDEQFDQFSAYIEELRATGAKVIYLDVPLHSVLRKDFPALNQYEQKLKPYRGKLHLTYDSMQDFASDDEFMDHIHAKPEFMPRWSERLAEIISKEIAR